MKNRLLLPMTALAAALILSPVHSSQPSGNSKTNDTGKRAAETKKKDKELPFEEIDFKTIKEGAVVAEINGKKITVNEVVQMMSSLPPQLRQIPMELLFMATRDQLIDMNLLKTEALKQKKQLEKLPEVQEAIENAKEQIILQTYMNELVEGKITTKRINEEYKKLKDKFPSDTDQVKVRLIILNNEAEAKNVLKDIEAGADFLKLAREKSIDEGTAKNDGLIDKYFNVLAKHEWLPGFEMLFKKDKKGQYIIKTSGVVKEPIKTPVGYAIYKVIDRKPFLFPKMREIKKGLIEQIKKEIIENETSKLGKKAKIQRLHPNTGKPMKSLKIELEALQKKLEETMKKKDIAAPAA